MLLSSAAAGFLTRCSAHRAVLALHGRRSLPSVDLYPRQYSNDTRAVVFYRWPTMRHLRFISRFKVYQVSVISLLLPPVTHWYTTGVIGGVTLAGAWIAGLGTTAVFSVLSHYFRQFVGEMAYIPTDNSLRVSTLTFMGNRRNLVFPLEDVVPVSDSESRPGGVFWRLEVADYVFLYSPRYGNILDAQLMRKVLAIDSEE